MPLISTLGTISERGYTARKVIPSTPKYSISMSSATADYVSISSEYIFSGSFTLEAWVKFNSGGVALKPTICGSFTVNNSQFRIGGNGNPGLISIYINGFTASGTTTINDNTWTHVAISRDSSTNTMYIFVNGNLDTTVGYAGSFYLSKLGETFSDDAFNGLMHGFRANNGTCLYSSSFSLPTANFTAVPGTVILTGQSATIANEASGPGLTLGNSASIVSQGPF